MSVASLRSRFTQRILPIQLPVGAEADFEGCVDLLGRRTLTWEGEDPRETIVIEGVPASMEAEAAQAYDDLVSGIADFDDVLADRYLGGEAIPAEDLKAALRRLTIEGRIVPVLCGSALRNKGIPPLLDAIEAYLPSPLDVPPVLGTHPRLGNPEERPHDPNTPLCALAFKVQIVDEGRRMTYVRLYSGRFDEKSDVYNASRGIKEKVSRIFQMHAKDRKRLEVIGAGSIVGVLGLKLTQTGDTLCDPAHPIVLEPIGGYEPVISMAIEPEVQADKERLDQTLRRIADEDPTFRFREDPDTGQTVMSGMGELHLDVVTDRIRRDFGVPARTGRPQVVYAETVTTKAEGAGICELEHDETRVYARVVVRVQPAARGTGTKSRPAPSLFTTPAFSAAAAQAALEAFRGGVLHGYLLTDIEAEVVSVEQREGYSCDETAVRIAVMNAVKDACGNARPSRLAPLGAIEVTCPTEFMGEVLGSLQARRGLIEDMEDRGPVKVIRATAPIERMFGYATELRSGTQGRGTFTMRFARYDLEG
jgi:elongation factor G